MQQPRDVQAGQRGVLRGLVQHRVARQQGRHDHVAADEVRVVPGRDVGHDAERDVRDLLVHACAVEHVLVAYRSLDLVEEEVDPRQQAVQLVARLADRLADLLRQRGGQHFQLGHQQGAKALHGGQPLGHRRGRPARAARRAPRRPWPRPWQACRRPIRRSGCRWPGCGWRGSGSWCSRAARRRRESLAGSARRRSACDRPGRGTPGAIAPRRRSSGPASARPRSCSSSGQRASTVKSAARSLMPWWCTLLTVVRRVPG